MLWSSLSAETKSSFAYLDCLWFSLCRKGLPKARVLTWVRGGHVLSKKYVLVPLVCWFMFDIYKVEGKLDHKKAIRKFLCWCRRYHNKGIKMIMDENWFSAESMQNFCSQVTSFCSLELLLTAAI
ncbi:hypothetical protein MKW98_002357 [Papaver atlanticum]|uniref:Uncharacterized protein n=1 Tax=Papaver atlanticum TaxID=357466 RepID=A0AAD4SAC0_9MAGN|nr:hypothetical protein MKW98_002357 [Papaver atlanticum]